MPGDYYHETKRKRQIERERENLIADIDIEADEKYKHIYSGIQVETGQQERKTTCCYTQRHIEFCVYGGRFF